jgi:UDP-N-acetylmuramate dehydrogenase
MTEPIPLSLKLKNSFAVETNAKEIFFPRSIEDLMSLPDLNNQAVYILGEGSNTLFIDKTAPIVICPDFKGITITESKTDYQINVGASINWHELVKICMSKSMFGLENLALIPGSVGAAPVQNIGAYGVEFADCCLSIDWFDFQTKTIKSMGRQACKFGYRDSIFKHELNSGGLITGITLKLAKKWSPKLSYHGLSHLPEEVSAHEVFSQVVRLRESKLPDPKLLPNAGSFFKNPVVDLDKLALLKHDYPNIPFYQQSHNTVKLAAGWLIEQCGLKGYTTEGVGLYDKQALVLVNYSSKMGGDIFKLAKYVQACVDKKFSVILEAEVKMVTSSGEVNFDELNVNG